MFRFLLISLDRLEISMKENTIKDNNDETINKDKIPNFLFIFKLTTPIYKFILLYKVTIICYICQYLPSVSKPFSSQGYLLQLFIIYINASNCFYIITDIQICKLYEFVILCANMQL